MPILETVTIGTLTALGLGVGVSFGVKSIMQSEPVQKITSGLKSTTMLSNMLFVILGAIAMIGIIVLISNAVA